MKKILILAAAAALALGAATPASAEETVKFTVYTAPLEGIFFEVVALDKNNNVVAQTWDIKLETAENEDGRAVRYVEFPLGAVKNADRFCVSLRGFPFKVVSPHGKQYNVTCTLPGEFKPAENNLTFDYLIPKIVKVG